MRVLVQRVSRAEVRVGERVTGRIGRGLLLLIGFTHGDGEENLVWMADKSPDCASLPTPTTR
jgi:D-tyrosyl-tRNA(Tyr) deacylase